MLILDIIVVWFHLCLYLCAYIFILYIIIHLTKSIYLYILKVYYIRYYSQLLHMGKGLTSESSVELQ